MNNKLTILIVVITLALGGCSGISERQQNTAQGTVVGAGVGAAIGSVIGAIAGDPGLGASIGAGVGAMGGFAWSNNMEHQKKQMEQATAGTDIEVTQTENNQLKMNIPGDFSFDSGRAEIKPNMFPVLNSLVAGLMSNSASQARIVGHTDNTGTDEINNPLSINRAGNTRAYLVNQGIQSNRIVIDGRSSYEPIAPNNNLANRAKNRRVEIFVFEPQQPQAQQQQPPQYQPQQYQQPRY